MENGGWRGVGVHEVVSMLTRLCIHRCTPRCNDVQRCQQPGKTGCWQRKKLSGATAVRKERYFHFHYALADLRAAVAVAVSAAPAVCLPAVWLAAAVAVALPAAPSVAVRLPAAIPVARPTAAGAAAPAAARPRLVLAVIPLLIVFCAGHPHLHTHPSESYVATYGSLVCDP